MIDVQSLDRTGRREVRLGFMRRLWECKDDQNTVIRDAHKMLPGFTPLMTRNVQIMSPYQALEKTLQTLLAAPAKPKFRRAAPQSNSSVRCIGLDKLKF